MIAYQNTLESNFHETQTMPRIATVVKNCHAIPPTAGRIPHDVIPLPFDKFKFSIEIEK